MTSIPMNYIGMNRRLCSENYRLQLPQTSLSEDFVTDPSGESQLLIQIQVSLTNDLLAPIPLGEDNGRSLNVTERCLMRPIQVEFPVNLHPNSGDHNAYHHIDALVSNRFLSTEASDMLKQTISECVIPGFAPFLSQYKPKWLRVSLVVEIERVYFAGEYGNVYVLDNVTAEALETKRFNRVEDLGLATGGRIGSCSVCLDEFSLGRDIIAKMPCSHVFHEGCILQWLQRRSTCPLCRYEMPTARTRTKVPTA